MLHKIAKKLKRAKSSLQQESSSNQVEGTSDKEMQSSMRSIRELQQLSHTPLLIVHPRQEGNATFKCMCLNSDAEGGRPLTKSSPRAQIEEMTVNDCAIMPVGSITKVFINFAFLRVMYDQSFPDFSEKITWRTKVFDLFNALTEMHNQRSGENLSPIRALEGDPSIGQLLCHINGVPPMYERLIGPEGTCYMTKEEFINRVPEMMKTYRKDNLTPANYTTDYSNGNHVLAAIILELGLRTSIGDILKKLVFDPMRMTHTFVGECPEQFKSLCKSGYMLNSDFAPRAITPTGARDVVEAAVLGAWSTAVDVDKFFYTLLEIKGETCNIEGLKDLAGSIQEFFTSPDADDVPGESYYTLCGWAESLPSNSINQESLNKTLIGESKKNLDYELGMYGETPLEHCLFSKAGYVDGFSIQVCVSVKQHIVIVVMGNATGPLTVTDYVAHMLLQSYLSLSPPVDFIKQAQRALKQSRHKMELLEKEEDSSTSDPINSKLFNSCYKDSISGLEIIIVSDREVYMGALKRTDRLRLVQVSPTEVRIIAENGFGIERWSTWKNLNFGLELESRCVRALIRHGCRYKKIDST